jgi:hypothetical protein
MSNPLLSPTFLFRFSVPCRQRCVIWDDDGIRLEPRYRLPGFGELDGKHDFADVRCAWNPDGLALNVRVAGKRQSLWCRATQPGASDGLRIWIDTRDTHTIHRAGRYCHQFFFLPCGDGPELRDPVARSIPINRAKENPRLVTPSDLAVRSQLTGDGYLLQAHVPSAALTGFDPVEYPRLGFFYAVVDRELGWQTFGAGTEFPFAEDPSLWGTLELEA